MKRRKERLTEAMAKAITLTDAERAIMDKYDLNPEMAAFVITPKFVPGGVPEVPSKEDMDIIRRISEKLNNNIITVQKYEKT